MNRRGAHAARRTLRTDAFDLHGDGKGWWLVAAMTGAITLFGCGASPEPQYYTLSSYPGSSRPDAPRLIKLRRPGLAGYLDRPDVVYRVVDYRVRIANGERWGEPLGDMISRVLAEDLTQRLPESSVFTESGAISVDADANVEVDVLRFDMDKSGVVSLLAQVAVERGHGRTVTASQSLSLAERPTEDGTASLVAAMSKLLGQLADRIALLVRID